MNKLRAAAHDAGVQLQTIGPFAAALQFGFPMTRTDLIPHDAKTPNLDRVGIITNGVDCRFGAQRTLKR